MELEKWFTFIYVIHAIYIIYGNKYIWIQCKELKYCNTE